MRLVLDSDWFTPAPDGVYMVRCGGQIKFVLVLGGGTTHKAGYTGSQAP